MSVAKTAALRLRCIKPINHTLIKRYYSINPKKLPSESESQRSQISKWFTEKLDNLQTTVLTAGRKLNDITGYSAIETIRKEILVKEQELVTCRQELRDAKEEYSKAISKRSSSQKEVNELLQRKHNWSPEDVQRVTELYKEEYDNQMYEQSASTLVDSKDAEFEDRRLEIAKLISERYHEEQIWSDKIRRASTYGTWVLMGFNVFLFIVVQLGLEPWKRRRLVGSFEEKVKSALETNSIQKQGRIDELEKKMNEPVSTSNPQEPENLPVSSDTSLNWKNLPQRIATSLDTSNPFTIQVKEFASTSAVTVVIGALLGSLITLAFKN